MVRRLTKFIPILCLLLTTACQPTAKKLDQVTEDEKEEKGEITLVDLSGNEWKQSKDKILILNLWATWCKPCIEEMPALAEMVKQLPDKFEILLASDENLERINAFVTKTNIDLPFGQLTSNIENLGVYSLPTTIVFNTKGEVLETIVGAQEWNTPERIDKFLTYLQ